MSTCYALLGFLEKIPTGSELKGFESRCEQLAVEGFAFSQVGTLNNWNFAFYANTVCANI